MGYYNELESTERFLERLKNHIKDCGSTMLNLTDECLEYSLFEGGALNKTIFYLTDGALMEVKDKWLVSEEVCDKIVLLGNKIRELEDTSKWCVRSVRKDKEWRDIMMLADEIKTLL